MVVLSLEQYAALTDDIELKLDEADKARPQTPFVIRKMKFFRE